MKTITIVLISFLIGVGTTFIIVKLLFNDIEEENEILRLVSDLGTISIFVKQKNDEDGYCFLRDEAEKRVKSIQIISKDLRSKKIKLTGTTELYLKSGQDAIEFYNAGPQVILSELCKKT